MYEMACVVMQAALAVDDMRVEVFFFFPSRLKQTESRHRASVEGNGLTLPG